MVPPLDGSQGPWDFMIMTLGLCVKQPLYIWKLDASFSFKNYIYIYIYVVIIQLVQHMIAPITIAQIQLQILIA